jgi:membrane-associated protein
VAGDGVLPLLPGETAIITGGNLASTGRLTIELVILAGAVGAVIGDSAAYWIGRAGGIKIRAFVSRLAGEERVVAAERLIARRGSALVFVGRFLPGIRLAINVSCGAGHMGYGRFLIFDSLGAIVWSSQAGLLGYFLGKSFADQPWVGLLIALGVATLVAVFVGIKERRLSRAEAEREDQEGEGHAKVEVDEPVRER